jgi:UDP-N-acetylmuramate dehydrogenase
MLSVLENCDITGLNTFRIKTSAKALVKITNEKELDLFLNSGSTLPEPFLPLGQGSNVLFTKDFPGTVIHMQIPGIVEVMDHDDAVTVQVNAGESWDGFVKYTVEKGLGGLENLSWIPGLAGASPIQNIGAYGVEVKDVIAGVHTVDIKTGETVYFSNKECQFGYRNSIFKYSAHRYLVTSIDFLLSKKPTIQFDYLPLQEELEGVDNPAIKDIRNAVIAIRKRKLPDPKEIGNAGSVFKNPQITEMEYDDLRHDYKEMPVYKTQTGSVKIPAAWLIEKCGFKDKRQGDAGVYKNQPLVLVNHGNATGSQILEFAQEIISAVKEKFSIPLEFEVSVL